MGRQDKIKEELTKVPPSYFSKTEDWMYKVAFFCVGSGIKLSLCVKLLECEPNKEAKRILHCLISCLECTEYKGFQFSLQRDRHYQMAKNEAYSCSVADKRNQDRIIDYILSSYADQIEEKEQFYPTPNESAIELEELIQRIYPPDTVAGWIESALHPGIKALLSSYPSSCNRLSQLKQHLVRLSDSDEIIDPIADLLAKTVAVQTPA